LVDQIFVDINSAYNFLVAVVTLSEERLLQFADVNGLEGDIQTLVNTQDVEYGVLKQMERTANTSKLGNIEKILRVHISAEKFSAQNGLLTNTHKLKRQELKQKFKKNLDKLYESYFMKSQESIISGKK